MREIAPVGTTDEEIGFLVEDLESVGVDTAEKLQACVEVADRIDLLRRASEEALGTLEFWSGSLANAVTSILSEKNDNVFGRIMHQTLPGIFVTSVLTVFMAMKFHLVGPKFNPPVPYDRSKARWIGADLASSNFRQHSRNEYPYMFTLTSSTVAANGMEVARARPLDPLARAGLRLVLGNMPGSVGLGLLLTRENRRARVVGGRRREKWLDASSPENRAMPRAKAAILYGGLRSAVADLARDFDRACWRG